MSQLLTKRTWPHISDVRGVSVCVEERMHHAWQVSSRSYSIYIIAVDSVALELDTCPVLLPSLLTRGSKEKAKKGQRHILMFFFHHPLLPLAVKINCSGIVCTREYRGEGIRKRTSNMSRLRCDLPLSQPSSCCLLKVSVAPRRNPNSLILATHRGICWFSWIFLLLVIFTYKCCCCCCCGCDDHLPICLRFQVAKCR